MRRIDLHVHSNCSDGTYTPKELVDYAIAKGLLAFALTDHDTIEGIAEAILYARTKDIEVIPGIELSTDYHGNDIHILGLYIDPLRPAFRNHLTSFRNSRDERNRKMCHNLRTLGIDISLEQLQEASPDAVITRAHFARFLINHNYVKNMAEAFDKYVGDDCPSYVHREKVTPEEAVQLILSADGIPVLAHPILYHLPPTQLDALVSSLKDCGLMGIEGVYSAYAPSEERTIKRLAAKYNLLITGGSDFHGANKPGLDLADGYGKLFVPEEILHKIKEVHETMSHCLLSVDMDGTLLTDEKNVSEETFCALNDCINAGHRLVISTGRPFKSLLQLVEQNNLSYPGLILSAFNGGFICDYDTKTVLLQKSIAKDAVHIIRELAQEAHLHFHAYTLDEIVSERETEEMHYYCSYVKLPFHVVPDLTAPLLPSLFKVLTIDLNDHEKLEQLRQKIELSCGDSLQCVFSDAVFLEVLPKDSGKGEALSFLSSYLSVPRSKTYAFGDAENDISMLQTAGHGIAMKNAPTNVQSAADIITAADNNHDGLVPFFRELTESH